MSHSSSVSLSRVFEPKRIYMFFRNRSLDLEFEIIDRRNYLFPTNFQLGI